MAKSGTSYTHKNLNNTLTFRFLRRVPDFLPMYRRGSARGRPMSTNDYFCPHGNGIELCGIHRGLAERKPWDCTRVYATRQNVHPVCCDDRRGSAAMADRSVDHQAVLLAVGTAYGHKMGRCPGRAWRIPKNRTYHTRGGDFRFGPHRVYRLSGRRADLRQADGHFRPAGDHPRGGIGYHRNRLVPVSFTEV